MGHCSASDAYTKRFDDSVQDILRKYKCVDNTLLYDTCVEDAFWHTYEFLDTCARAGITLKPEKFRFCRREAEFVGFHLGWEHYQPTSERLAAIREFAMPDRPTITDIRSWHGMVNQLAPFLATAPVMEPFRELLKRPAGKPLEYDGPVSMDEEMVAKAASEDPAYQLLFNKVMSETGTSTKHKKHLVCGLDSMLRRARQSVYWPGMEGDLQHHRNRCQDCENHTPSLPPEPLVITPPPDYPFQQVVADMFQLEGNSYLAYADRLTGWLELAHFPSSTSSSKIITCLRRFFASLDNDRASKALLQYLNTPLRDVNKSPAQLATSRQLRDGVPVAKQHYRVDQHWKKNLRQRERAMARTQDELPQARGGVHRQLPPLEPGTRVWIQDADSKLWDRTGIIVESRPYRQYAVRLIGSGRISIRNRRHLRQAQTLITATPPPSSGQDGADGSGTPGPGFHKGKKVEKRWYRACTTQSGPPARRFTTPTTRQRRSGPHANPHDHNRRRPQHDSANRDWSPTRVVEMCTGLKALFKSPRLSTATSHDLLCHPVGDDCSRFWGVLKLKNRRVWLSCSDWSQHGLDWSAPRLDPSATSPITEPTFLLIFEVQSCPKCIEHALHSRDHPRAASRLPRPDGDGLGMTPTHRTTGADTA
ncbi:Retrovirus-related Pol polyprotein from transposon gypsy [Chionoecetes opilio]|uniref:RNA-directed DNA polymerase n=1 Tax=Chionoecetes opilio TaxID=41210 RepID=A0A8J4XQ46_CHIOP|nr:Retrovirus-related Pol polyprotein from transposon gypsy [Chionoecetes opilio]